MVQDWFKVGSRFRVKDFPRCTVWRKVGNADLGTVHRSLLSGMEGRGEESKEV